MSERNYNKRKFQYMSLSERLKICQKYNRSIACSNCQSVGIKDGVPWCYEDSPCYFGQNKEYYSRRIEYIPIDLGFDEAFFNQLWEAKK